MKSHNFTFAKR